MRERAYWARPWPSGVVLASLIAGELADRVRGRAVIELGCGRGAAGIAAARVGADVTLSDGEPEALEVAAENAAASGVRVRLVALDWDRVPDALVGRFDVVLGTDIAYDRTKLTPLAGAIEALLAPGGEAWIADPARLAAAMLLDALAGAGLHATRVRTEPHPPGVVAPNDEEPVEIAIYRVVRGGSSRP